MNLGLSIGITGKLRQLGGETPIDYILNDSFPTNTDNWILGQQAASGTIAWDSGRLSITGSVVNCSAQFAFETVIGQTYTVSVNHIDNGSGGWCMKSDQTNGITVNRVDITPTNTSFGISTTDFIATAKISHIHLLILGAGTTAIFDDILIYQVDPPALAYTPIVPTDGTAYPITISLCVDDLGGLSDFLTLSAYAETKGWNMTYAPDTLSASAANWTSMTSAVVNGHEIASHTVNHWKLTSASHTPTEVLNQLIDSKAAIEAGLLANEETYVVKTLVPPYNDINAAAITAAITAGYEYSRGGLYGGGEFLWKYSTLTERVGPFNVYYSNPIWNMTPGNIESDTAALLADLAKKGGHVCFFTHGAGDGISNLSIADFKLMMDEIAATSGVTVMTLGEQCEFMKTYDPYGDIGTVDGGLTYTRTMVPIP